MEITTNPTTQTETPVVRLAEFSVTTEDLKKTKAFYAEALGLTVAEEQEGGWAAMVDSEGKNRILIRQCDFLTKPCLSVELTPYDEGIKQLKENGVEIAKEMGEPGKFRCGEAKTPDGHSMLFWSTHT